TAEVRDRDARHTVNGVDAIELECLDDEVKAIRQLTLCFGCGARRFPLILHCCFGHGSTPASFVSGRQSRWSAYFSTCSASPSACVRTSSSAWAVSRVSIASMMCM